MVGPLPNPSLAEFLNGDGALGTAGILRAQLDWAQLPTLCKLSVSLGLGP